MSASQLYSPNILLTRFVLFLRVNGRFNLLERSILLNFTSVISLNDLINWEKDNLWLETIGGDLTQLTKNQIAMLILLGAVWGSDNYDKTWRCWNFEPTDE